MSDDDWDAGSGDDWDDDAIEKKLEAGFSLSSLYFLLYSFFLVFSFNYYRSF